MDLINNVQALLPTSYSIVESAGNSMEWLLHLEWEGLRETTRITVPEVFRSDIEYMISSYPSSSWSGWHWPEMSWPQFSRGDAPRLLPGFRENPWGFSFMLNENTFTLLARSHHNTLLYDRNAFFFNYDLTSLSLNPLLHSLYSSLSLIRPYIIPLTGIITISLYSWISNNLVPFFNKLVNSLLNLLAKWLANIQSYIRNKTGRAPNNGPTYTWRSMRSLRTGWNNLTWVNSGRALFGEEDSDDEDPEDDRRYFLNPYDDEPISPYLTLAEIRQIRLVLETLIEQTRNGGGWDTPQNAIRTAQDWFVRLERIEHIIEGLPPGSNPTSAYSILRILLKWLHRTITGIVGLLYITPPQNLIFSPYYRPSRRFMYIYESLDEFPDVPTELITIRIHRVTLEAAPDQFVRITSGDPNVTFIGFLYNRDYILRRLCWISDLLRVLQRRDPTYQQP